MFNVNLIVKMASVILFNSLDASVNNISTILNDVSHSINDIKKRYILIKYDIFSPENSVSTDYDIFLDSLLAISNQLNTSRYEIFKNLLDYDIEKKHIDKISKIELEFELLNNSVHLLHSINKYYNPLFKNNLNSFDEYKTQVKRLISFENLLFQTE